ncbi:MAG: TonB-dependent receptor plug domain-containing protein, partial [Bacteroidales bacterium]|nr:TonB-dependent receptor plug domain-containing protein [Bacteroidales bacterium]
MKLNRIIQIFLCFVLAINVANAQSGNYTITVSLDNVTLEEAISKIEQNSRYSFFYDSGTIDLKQKVSLQAKQMEIADALRQMLAKLPVTFEISNRQIVLIPTKPIDTRPVQEMITIKGTVSEKGTGERLVGAVVSVLGFSNLYTLTDANGQYSINAPANGMMKVELIGMYPVEFFVGGRTNIPIILEADVVSLEGTVVTGYQTLSADRATGSFGMVDAKVMQEKPIANIQSMLEGQVAGLNVDNDGNITIRGISTFNASSKPLVVVDGFPVEETMHDSELFQVDNSIFNNINADNIESITVLKDAVAASIYGARAANGVIVITTKKGRSGATKVSYKGTFSVKSRPTTKDLNMATSEQALDGFLKLYESMPMYSMPGYANYTNAGYYYWMRDNGLMSAEEAESAVNAMRKNNYFGEVDKYLFRPELIHQHNLSISGGNEKNTFNVAANYQGTRGNFVFANNHRVTVDMRDDLRINRIVSLSLGMNLNYATSKTPVMNPVYGGMEYASGKLFDFSELVSVFNPYMSFFNADGTPKSIEMIVPMIKQNYSYITGLKSTELNLYEDLQQSTYSTQDFQSRINGSLNFNIIQGLTINLGGNWQRGNYLCRQYYQAESFYARRVYNSGISLLNTDDRIFPDGGILNEKRNNNQSWTVRG